VHNWEARAVPESSDARIADLHDQVDVVLVDAPCSGLGALRRNPDARWRLDEAEVASFPPRQKEILDRYSRLVKPGGRLVYATCSINRAENEDVRAAFLAAHPQFEPAEALPPSLGLGTTSDIHLLPHRHGTDGFYITALRRH
jgi:16S rRNA (cytosine967-C5)-methyltransferase